MRILFSMRHPGVLRNFASTLEALAARNHQIHLVFGQLDAERDDRLLDDLTRAHPTITCAEVRRKTSWRLWLGVGRVARTAVDYFRYLTPEYDSIVSLKERARAKVIAPVRWFIERSFWRRPAAHRRLTRVLLAVERAVPIDRAVFDLVRRERPDVLLVAPLVDIGSDQVDYVKAARRLGIRSALPVLSWDNLTNKGLIRLQPQQVFVWNDAQKTEAVTMHGTDPADITVTGAMVYDQWFARRPSTTRDEFCARVGLDPANVVLLYLCSSPFIAPDEVNFIEQWIAAIRRAPDPRVRGAGLLIRPHPENLQPWLRFGEIKLENVAVWPKGGVSPVDADSRNDFFDSMYHAAGAVGINTSAQIECGIVGRPVFTIRTPDYHRTQEGTLHFRHLTTEGGGLLNLADDFETHVRQIAEALDDPAGTRRRIERFVQVFTRPHGLAVEATPQMVAAIERLGARPAPAPEPPPLYVYPLRVVLFPVALTLALVRRISRVTRKRERQLRPVTVTGTLVQMTLSVFDWLLGVKSIREFVKNRILPRAVARLSAVDAPSEEAVAVAGMLQKMARSEKPVIVGPWVSEVGFELLYWIPFLNWVKANYPIQAERMVVVSRGGAGAWYRHIGARYIDLFDYYTPEEFRQQSEQRITDGKPKPRTISEFDRDILKLVQQTLHIRDGELLHPMHMYRLFHEFWQRRGSVSVVEDFASFAPLPSLDAGEVASRLPDDYVAIRFYFNDAFPDTEANRRFVENLVTALAETTDVVVLSPAVQLDDHQDLPIARRGRVHAAASLMSPRTNLDVQSQIIARARAFLGTHGGLSYLPPFYGVKSLSFYSNPGSFSPQHLELARRVFTRLQPGSYVALHVDDLATLQTTLGERYEAIAGIARRL
ncbi:MAG TPA: hypothetical protein VFO21_27195 [Vicinamibacterales bacterium]|nr:hypothetical protein [Vicinamibacterales bacterium]